MISSKIKKAILFNLLLLVYFVGNGQNRNDLELYRKSWFDQYWVIPAGKDGLVVIFRNFKMSKKGQVVFEFFRYDSKFNKSWKTDMEFAGSQTLSCFESDDKYIYMVFIHDRYPLNPKYTIVQLEILTGYLMLMEGTLPDNFSPRYIKAKDGVLLWGGDINYDMIHVQTILLYTNMNKHITKTLERKELKDTKGSIRIDNIKTDSIAKCFNVYKTRWLQSNSVDITLTRYDMEGEVINRDVIALDNSCQILNTHETALNSNSIIYTGNFRYNSNYDLKIKYGPPSVTFVDGIYICKKNGTKTEFSRAYSFREISSFWNFVAPTQFTEKELKKHANKDTTDKSSGLNKDYFILSHDLILKDNRYILVAEVQINLNEYSQSLIGTQNNGIDDKSYSQLFCTIVCCFDMEGRLLWDKTLKGSSLHEFDSKQERVKINIQNDELIVYGIGNYAVKKNAIKSGVVKETEQVFDLKSGFVHPVDTLNGFRKLEMVFWYDNHLLVWGNQTFKSNRKIFKRPIDRSVFYFRKLTYSD